MKENKLLRNELDKYLKQNKHHPNIPPASVAEMEEEKEQLKLKYQNLEERIAALENK